MKSVSRNFSKTLASELIEVKPMSLPIGKLFYFDFFNAEDEEANKKLKIPTFNEPRLKPIKL